MHWKELELSGHMDGVVLPNEYVLHMAPDEKAVGDVKSMSDFAFAAINTVKDLLNSREWYHVAYITQPSLYAVHPQVDAQWCVLYCVKRSTAETKQIWWRTEDAVEQIVKAKANCIAINEAIKADKKDAAGDPLVPAELAVPGKWCGDCAFASICPEYVLESKGLVIAPQRIVELVERKAELDEAAKEHKKVVAELNTHWKTVEPGQHICGDYLVKVSEVKGKDMPAKPAYYKQPYKRTTYTRQ